MNYLKLKKYVGYISYQDKINHEFNSKFQEFKTVRILKKTTEFGPKNIATNQTIMRKTKKKGGKKKEVNLPKPLPSFSLFRFSFFFPPFLLVFLMIV